MSGFNPGSNLKINERFDRLSKDELYWLHEDLFPQKQSERNIGDIHSLIKECLHLIKDDQNMQIQILNKLEIFKKIEEFFFSWISDSDIRNLVWVQKKIDLESLNQNLSLFGINKNNQEKTYSKFRLSVSFYKIDSVEPQSNNLSLLKPILNMHDKKIKFIDNIKTEWQKWKNLTDSFSKWLENLDQNTLLWCYNYISKKESRSQNINLDTKITPIMVLVLIDSINFETTDAYIMYIERLKKSWSQYKFKSANKVKNKYHLPLTKQAKIFLEQLAEFKHKSEAEIMEELLKREYQDLMCDERGNLKY